MDINTIAGPVIGAVIGYCTNYIAVKMLFRPLRPVKIGKFTLPFTPGIIPKGKERLGKAVGEAIGGTLLTEEELARTMLSDEMKKNIGTEVRQVLLQNTSNEKEIGTLVAEYVGVEVYDSKKEELSKIITETLVRKAGELSLGTIIANEALKAVKSKVQGTFLAMMANDQMLGSFVEPISEGIDSYIRDNGSIILEPQVQSELEKAADKTVGDACNYIANSDGIDNIEEMVIKVYETFIRTRLSSMLKQIDLSSIVERKISEMDVMEVEQLVLSVMKKELNAVVNLGAIIGLILGLLNLVF